MDEGAGQERAVRIFKDLERPFFIPPERPGSGHQHAAIEKCSNHSGLANPATPLRKFSFEFTPGEQFFARRGDFLADPAESPPEL
jgi:hypothetical protein